MENGGKHREITRTGSPDLFQNSCATPTAAQLTNNGWNGMKWTTWNGMEWNGMEWKWKWNGMEEEQMEWND